MKTKDEQAEDFIIDNLSFGELVALKYDIPIADDEASGFDGYNFGGDYSGASGSIDDIGTGRRLSFTGNEDEFSDFNKKKRQALANKVKGTVKKVGGAVSGAVKKVGGGIKNTVQNVGNKIGDSKIGQAIKDSKVGGGIVSGLQKIGSGVKNVGSKIGSGLNNLKDKAGTVIKKVGDKIGDGLKAIGRGVVVATMSIPRASARALIALNFRGFATRIKESGGSSNKALMDKWYKLGGTPSKLMKSVATGQNKKPLICGVKCKEKMVQSNFLGADGRSLYEEARAELEYDNAVDPGTATLLATGGAVLTTIGTVISSKIKQKSVREQLEVEEALYEKELEQRSKELGVTENQLEKEFDLAEKNMQNQADPIKLIQNNPNLSPQEKAEAIRQAQDVLATETSGKIKKYAIYGGLGLIALFIGYKILKPKKG